MKKKDKSFWLNAVLAIVVFSVCMVIELLNHAAGDYLPHKDSGKWRQSSLISEQIWKEYYSSKIGDETLLNRPLTAKKHPDAKGCLPCQRQECIAWNGQQFRFITIYFGTPFANMVVCYCKTQCEHHQKNYFCFICNIQFYMVATLFVS